MAEAHVVSSEVQDGSANYRWVGHAVRVWDRAWTVHQFGIRAGKMRFRVTRALGEVVAAQAVNSQIRARLRTDYHLVEQSVRFTVDLPSLDDTLASDERAVLSRLADAYEQARRAEHRTTLELVARAAELPGPHRLVAADQFWLEVRSEPLAQALAELVGRLPTDVTGRGPAVFVLPDPVVEVVVRDYLPHATAGTLTVRPDTPPAVLETLKGLWQPAGGAMADLDAAYAAAQLLVE
jgi:hypothetical protein